MVCMIVYIYLYTNNKTKGVVIMKRLERAIKDLKSLGSKLGIDNIDNIISSRIINTTLDYFKELLNVKVDYVIDDDIIKGDNVGGYYNGIVYLNSNCTNDIKEFILTVGHECRHAWQQQIANDTFSKYEYIHYNGNNEQEYFEQPIEKDAYNYEDTIDIKTIINLITKALEN